MKNRCKQLDMLSGVATEWQITLSKCKHYCDGACCNMVDECPFDEKGLLEVKMKFRNFTPHKIILNDGREFTSEGVARVQTSFTDFDVNDICGQSFGDVEGLPEPEAEVRVIVSALVLQAGKAAGRIDLVAPATGHPDVIRNEEKQIVSVPGFVS